MLKRTRYPLPLPRVSVSLTLSFSPPALCSNNPIRGIFGRIVSPRPYVTSIVSAGEQERERGDFRERALQFGYRQITGSAQEEKQREGKGKEKKATGRIGVGRIKSSGRSVVSKPEAASIRVYERIYVCLCVSVRVFGPGAISSIRKARPVVWKISLVEVSRQSESAQYSRAAMALSEISWSFCFYSGSSA